MNLLSFLVFAIIFVLNSKFNEIFYIQPIVLVHGGAGSFVKDRVRI